MTTNTTFDFGSSLKPLFCLEMANNHSGSTEHGIRIVEAAAAIANRTNARVWLKLQFRELSTFLHPADRGQDLSDPVTKQAIRFRETELHNSDFDVLIKSARDAGIGIYSTPFDEPSVDRCVAAGFEAIKIGSPSAYDWPLLRKIAKTGLPVIASVGGLSINEIDDVVDLFRNSGNPLALMHCVSVYPTATEDLQIDVVRQYTERYPDITIGYSGHEDPQRPEFGGLALAKGAVLFERHFGVPSDSVKLNAYSLSPEQAEEWIATTVRAGAACGGVGNERRAVEGEFDALQSLRRGIYAKHSIPAGKTVTADDIFLSAPCFEGQFHAGKYYEIVDTFTPMADIHPNLPIGLDVTKKLPKSLIISSIIARVEEALRSAQITVESETELEISHQYGIEHFYEQGAVIVNIINRDYAKKILIQFPGQNHPGHHHIQKEETFQVLHGAVDLVVDGQNNHLGPGQTKLIEPGHIHSFSSRTGVIIEEVSTTHVPGDSVYVDSSIPSDPTTRKTVLLTS